MVYIHLFFSHIDIAFGNWDLCQAGASVCVLVAISLQHFCLRVSYQQTTLCLCSRCSSSHMLWVTPDRNEGGPDGFTCTGTASGELLGSHGFTLDGLSVQVACLLSSAGHVRSLSSSAFLLHLKYASAALFKG